MFLLNSRPAHFTAAHIAMGVPSPEVTVLICRVPERVFSQAPLDIMSSSTCVGLRYGQHQVSLEVFLGSVALLTYESYDSGLPFQR